MIEKVVRQNSSHFLLCVTFQIVSYDDQSHNWKWNEAQKFCGRQVPYAIQSNNANRLRVIFRSNNDVNGDGFNVRSKNFSI